MKLKLVEKPTIEIKKELAVIIFPSRPYWFSATREIKSVLDIIENEIEKEDAVNKIAKQLEIPDQEANETLDEVQNLLFLNGVLLVDNEISKEAKEINPHFQVNVTERVLVIATTQKCNLACLHCYADAKKPLSHELSTDDLKNLIDDLANMPWKREISSVGLTGGEFFTRKDALEIVDYVHKCGFRILISSNSLMLTEEIIQKLANYPDLKISISLDGPTAEIHENIRGPRTYKHTIKTIRKLADLGIFVGVNMFVHEGNVELIEDTLRLANKLGVKAFNCINLLYVGRANSLKSRQKLVRVPETILYQKIFEILRYNSRYQEMMQNSTFANQIMGIAGGIKSHYCGIGTNRALYVKADGSIYPCPDTAIARFCLGNIRNEKLKDIWEKSPILSKLRLLSVDSMNSKCALCDVRYFCGGSCRGENYQVTGSLRSPHFNCEEIRKTILEMIWMLVEEPEFFHNKVEGLYQTVCF